MKILKTINEKLFRVECTIGTILATVMVILLAMQVISRYLPGVPAMTWTEEIALILFIWSIYLGGSAAIVREQLLRVEIVTGKLPPVTKRVFRIIANVVMVLVLAYLGYGLIIVIGNLYKFNSKTPILGFPKFISYSMLPFCFVLMFYHLIYQSLDLIGQIKGLKDGSYKEEVVEGVDTSSMI